MKLNVKRRIHLPVKTERVITPRPLKKQKYVEKYDFNCDKCEKEICVNEK